MVDLVGILGCAPRVAAVVPLVMRKPLAVCGKRNTACLKGNGIKTEHHYFS